MAQQSPITAITFWRTGLYTNRSQLFAPFRAIGLNVITSNDALIDGQDMEVTDHFEIQRRPGFSRFCSQQLAASEIPNQFYSVRTPTGTVIPLIDTNQRLASFSTSAITTLWTKASSDQAFPLLVGSQIYAANSTANGQKRYDTGTNALHGMGIAAPASMPTLAPPTAAGSTFWQPNVAYGNTLVVLLDPNGNVQISSGALHTLTTGATPPAWNVSVGSHTTESSGFWVNLGPPDVWQASTVYAIQAPGAGQIIIDSNGNAQQLTTGGTSGSSNPTWATTPGTTTADNTVTWTCRGNATFSVFSGYQYVYVYSTQAPTVTTGYYHCSTASPVTYSTGPVFGTYSYTLQGAYSTNTDVGSVDIYRIKDGGGVLFYAGSVANNSAGGTWSFVDNIPDANLNTSLVVPLGTTHLNDPPPGSTGSIAPSTDKLGYLAYWQGRLWGIAYNKVYFDAGPDCINGDPHAAWPPAYVFQFPGQPIALAPTAAGLLVFLADSVKLIAGGPQTLSFYPLDLLSNFGISSPNCISRDGDNIRVLTTQGQLFTLSVSEKAEEGNFVADLIQSSFPPSSSYVTTHRNGLDSGMFLSNGTDTALRYGLNIQSWSPQYKPVGGIKALNSIETSVGKYTLCAGRASAQGYILGRDLTTYQDDGQNYTNCFVTVGNLTLSQPGQALVPVNYVVGYFAAVGTVPTISVLPNEISGTSGVGFITIPNPQNEPSTGAAASTTLTAKQWNLRQQQTLKTSLLMHHLQVKIAFPAENVANTIKVLSLKHFED